MNWQSVLLVFLGSGLGGFLRYAIANIYGRVDATGLRHFVPVFIVNIIGSFLIGIIYGLLEKNGLSNRMNLLLLTGFLGGFTTYSSFSLDILKLLQRGDHLIAFTYIILTLVIGILAVFAGFLIMK